MKKLYNNAHAAFLVSIRMKGVFSFLIFSLYFNQLAYAQGVSINSSNAVADASAMLDINSNSKGVLIPRMTAAERNAILSPATGLYVYNTDCNITEYCKHIAQ